MGDWEATKLTDRNCLERRSKGLLLIGCNVAVPKLTATLIMTYPPRNRRLWCVSQLAGSL